MKKCIEKNRKGTEYNYTTEKVVDGVGREHLVFCVEMVVAGEPYIKKMNKSEFDKQFIDEFEMDIKKYNL